MSERPQKPSVEDVRELPRLRGIVVPPEYEDFNGHMRITHHLGIHDDSGMASFGLFGIDGSYFAERRLGIVDLEHHIRYLSEVFAGDEVAVYSRFLERSEKLMHGIWFLVNESRGEVANSLEFVSLHIDLARRRSVAFPEDVAARIDGMVDAHARLGWEPPVCGFMGLGRPAPPP